VVPLCPGGSKPEDKILTFREISRKMEEACVFDVLTGLWE
jgi:hypothetical protein